MQAVWPPDIALLVLGQLLVARAEAALEGVKGPTRVRHCREDMRLICSCVMNPVNWSIIYYLLLLID